MIRYLGMAVMFSFLLIAGWTGAAVAQPAAEEPRFFAMLPDIPLMPGMDELDESAVVFDKPEGRIVESAAAGAALPGASVAGFYESTLPQLGWQPARPGVFVRQGEQLLFTVEEKTDYTMIRFMVRPRL